MVINHASPESVSRLPGPCRANSSSFSGDCAVSVRQRREPNPIAFSYRAVPGHPLQCASQAVVARQLLGNAVERAFTAQVEFAINQRRRSAEGILQVVHCQDGVLPVVPKNDRRTIAGHDVNPLGGRHR